MIQLSDDVRKEIEKFVFLGGRVKQHGNTLVLCPDAAPFTDARLCAIRIKRLDCTLTIVIDGLSAPN